MIKTIFSLLLLAVLFSGCHPRVVHGPSVHVHKRIANGNKCACGHHYHKGKWVLKPGNSGKNKPGNSVKENRGHGKDKK